MNGLTLELAHARSASLDTVGGKALNLARLTQAGFTVPAGFIVTANAWREHTAELSNSSASTWREAVIAKPLAVELRTELHRAWLALGAQAVAVRSSATLEDGSAQSLAGHFESWLNLSEFADVEIALKRCWASVRADGRADGGVMAVVIQSLVTPRASGVMFTSVGEKRDGIIGIESVFGLGEALVSGLVTPDRYTLSADSGEIVRREPSGSPVMLYPGEKNAGRLYGDEIEIGGTNYMVLREANFTGIVALRIPEVQAVAGSLSDEALRALWEIARRMRSEFGLEMDVEWAWDGATVFVLQARAITAPVPWQAKQTASSGPSTLRGIAAAPGRASGTVVVLEQSEDGSRVQHGDILVAYQTLPRWFFAMNRASAVVTETGGLLSHAAIVARELGVPCVSAIDNVTETLQSGQFVTVDGDTGAIFTQGGDCRAPQAPTSVWKRTPPPLAGEWAAAHAALLHDPFDRTECGWLAPPSLPLTRTEKKSLRARQGQP